MSTHPNTILMAVLTPHALSRKTMANIRAEGGFDEEHGPKIGKREFSTIIMETDYDEGKQISAKEGDLVFWDFVTYGYGEVVAWSELEAAKTELEAWAKGICERHACDYRIEVTANYW